MFACRYALETDRGRRRWHCACGRRGTWRALHADVYGVWRRHRRDAWLSRHLA
jgi:hypothetical protein